MALKYVLFSALPGNELPDYFQMFHRNTVREDTSFLCSLVATLTVAPASNTVKDLPLPLR
jgi:hypothetical protein